MAACLAALSACSQDAAPPPDTVPEPTTTTAQAVATTAPPTATGVDDEAAVRAAHLAYLEMFEVVGDPPDPDHPELALRATGDAYERLRASLIQARAAGLSLNGGWQSSVRSVAISGDTAVVTDCLLDLGAVRDSAGEVVVPADTVPTLQSTDLVRTSDGWRVSRLNLPTATRPCDA